MECESKSLRGQWMGLLSGTNSGLVIANFEEFPSYFKGVAYFIENNKKLPGIVAFFKTPTKSSTFSLRAALLPIDPKTGTHNLWENIKTQFGSDVQNANFADIEGKLADGQLLLGWKTDIGTNGQIKLTKSLADTPSVIIPQVLDWEGYKKHVSNLKGRSYLFRGQRKAWRLRTSYHRTGRCDLHYYLENDIKTLHRHLSARTDHVFNLSIPDENGAFLNLAQHHGYPTPLLDWTYSPYVAAFFAFRGISNKEAEADTSDSKVRIHVFNQAEWKADLVQVHLMLSASPHVSIGEFIGIENVRMVPQQSASTVTNIDDMESYIGYQEKQHSKEYLWAIDLPMKQRKLIIEELSYMGITSGTLFPGLDGACEELKERYFDL